VSSSITNLLDSASQAAASAAQVVAHIADATGAHAATAISATPSGTKVGTDAQTILDEIITDSEAHDAAAAPHTGHLDAADFTGADKVLVGSGVGTFAERDLGVVGASDILRRSDGDGRFATTAQGAVADAALPRAGGQMSGNITMAGAETVDGVDVSAHNHSGAGQGGTVADSSVEHAANGSPAVSSVGGLLDNVLSSCVIGGYAGISDNGDGTVQVSAGNGLIRATDSDTAQLLLVSWAQVASLALTDSSDNFIYLEYNAGSPQIVASPTALADENTNIALDKAFREGTEIHILSAAQCNINNALRWIRDRFVETEGFKRADGGILGEIGVRNITITSGEWYYGLSEVNTNNIDTSGADDFTVFYTDAPGTGFDELAAQTQIDNTNYDTGTGLAAMTNNRYGVRWVYLSADSHVFIRVGTSNATSIANALNEDVPSSTLAEIESHGFILGRIVIQKGAVVFAQTDTFNGDILTSTGAVSHASTAGLQGGTVGEFYHLTADEHTDLTAMAALFAEVPAFPTTDLDAGGSGVSYEDDNGRNWDIQWANAQNALDWDASDFLVKDVQNGSNQSMTGGTYNAPMMITPVRMANSIELQATALMENLQVAGGVCFAMIGLIGFDMAAAVQRAWVAVGLEKDTVPAYVVRGKLTIGGVTTNEANSAGLAASFLDPGSDLRFQWDRGRVTVSYKATGAGSWVALTTFGVRGFVPTHAFCAEASGAAVPAGPPARLMYIKPTLISVI